MLNLSAESTWRVQPNPAHTEFVIQGPRMQGLRYRVLTLTGQPVAQGKWNGTSIEVRDWPNGTYLLQLQDAKTGHLEVVRMVVLH